MKILISGTELNVKDCFARELANGARFLNITFLQSDISYDELDAIFAESDGKIILTKDDGNTQVFAGYSFTPEITGKTEADGTKVFAVTVKCVAEAERQALEAKAEVEVLKKELAEKTVTIATQTLAINSLNEQLLMVQMAAADLYEKSLAAEETTEEVPAEEVTEPEVAESEVQ